MEFSGEKFKDLLLRGWIRVVWGGGGEMSFLNIDFEWNFRWKNPAFLFIKERGKINWKEGK